MPTFGKIKLDLLTYAGEDVAGDPEIMAESAINRAYRRVLRAARQDTLRREFPLVTASGRAQYGMPMHVKHILNIEDPDNDKSVGEISASEFDLRYPGRTDAGDPDVYYILGAYGVQRQPNSAGVLSVVSSSTADVTNFFMRVSGYNASGVLVNEQVTINGTTAVSTTASFAPAQGGIDRLIKSSTNSSYSFTGSLTVTDDDSNTLAIIPAWEESPEYIWIEFFPVPDSVITYTVRCLSYKPDLINDDDWPDIGKEYHDLIMYDAGQELLPNFGKRLDAANFARMAKDGYKALKSQSSRRLNKAQVFADVSRSAALPRRPLIPGVDIGLASG